MDKVFEAQRISDRIILLRLFIGNVVFAAEMLINATGEEGVVLIRELAEAVFSNGIIPTDWEESYILNLYKGKGMPSTVAISLDPSLPTKS